MDIFDAITIYSANELSSNASLDEMIADTDKKLVALNIIYKYAREKSGYDQRVHICKNCGKSFISKLRTDTYYCDRQAPQDNTKTCKQYGAEKAWTNRTKDENDWYSWYRKVYQSFQMKARRNPNNPQLKKNFDNFRKEANEWKKAIKDKTKTEKEFVNWLQEFRQ